MKIVDWPSGVNRIVLNEASLSLAENGVESDKSDNGSEVSRLKASGTPDRFQVSMYFSNSRSDSFYRNHTDALGNHYTEWKKWSDWFKFVTMNGMHPFYFSDIQKPDGGAKIYKISSGGLPHGTPTGEYVKVTMTWIEVFNEYITVQQEETLADSIDINPGMIDLRFTEKPEETPKLEDFRDAEGNPLSEFSVDDGVTWSPLVLNEIDYDGQKSVILYYDSGMTAIDGQTYYIRLKYKDGGWITNAFTYCAEE